MTHEQLVAHVRRAVREHVQARLDASDARLLASIHDGQVSLEVATATMAVIHQTAAEGIEPVVAQAVATIEARLR